MTPDNELLSVISRNAKRLNRLSDDILDATKVESKSLELKKEQFNLNDVILYAIDDILLGKRVSSENLQILYEPHDILLHADKSRIAEVISNLLSNAIKFDKTVEMDASIMDGRDISAGSVGMATGMNPIKLARQIMERTDHVMIVSDGVTKLSKLFGNTVEQELSRTCF